MHNDLQRVLIIGNSGSGKSWLARQLAEKFATPATDLDNLNWEPGGYVKARAAIRDIWRCLQKPARHSRLDCPAVMIWWVFWAHF